jgi:hypothetical protein
MPVLGVVNTDPIELEGIEVKAKRIPYTSEAGAVFSYISYLNQVQGITTKIGEKAVLSKMQKDPNYPIYNKELYDMYNLREDIYAQNNLWKDRVYTQETESKEIAKLSQAYRQFTAGGEKNAEVYGISSKRGKVRLSRRIKSFFNFKELPGGNVPTEVEFAKIDFQTTKWQESIKLAGKISGLTDSEIQKLVTENPAPKSTWLGSNKNKLMRVVTGILAVAVPAVTALQTVGVLPEGKFSDANNASNGGTTGFDPTTPAITGVTPEVNTGTNFSQLISQNILPLGLIGAGLYFVTSKKK